MYEIGKQLKKGVIEILVLKLLSTENMYGYQIIQALDNRSNGIFKMKEGTLYPILYRLEDEAFIESYWEQSLDKRGVPRKYYKITAKGLKGLDEMSQTWEAFNHSVNSILRGLDYE